METWKKELLEHLSEIEFFARWKEENPFKIRAFERARESLQSISEDNLRKHIESATLTSIEGVGKGIAQIIKEFYQEKTSREWERLSEGIPTGIWELQSLPGLGLKKIKALYEGLGVKTIGELAYACQENRLVRLPGFGSKTQANILKALDEIKQREGKLILADALKEAQKLEEKFSSSILYGRVGALGRKFEIVDIFEYLVQSNKKLHPKQPSGNKKQVDFEVKSGIRVRFYFTDADSFFVERVFRTSSDEHWKALQKKAKSLGLHLENSSLLNSEGKYIPIKSEEELYEQLKLKFHPEEYREWVPETKKISLCESSDLKGAFHAHTNFSDGSHSVKEMADTASSLGWKYLGLSDHSRSAFYAHGLEAERLDSYFKEIENYNRKQNQIRIFAGIESDILKDGELDYPAQILSKFDFIIASIHQRYGMKDMTDRLLRAIENPYTRMIGHLSGRLLLGRDAYAYDLEKIVRRAVEKNVAIELNASPRRLDIDWRELHQACQSGLLISINPDAHSKDALSDVEYGISMARKAGVPSSQIINTWPINEVENFLSKGKSP